jgi:hypothetical protein
MEDCRMSEDGKISYRGRESLFSFKEGETDYGLVISLNEGAKKFTEGVGNMGVLCFYSKRKIRDDGENEFFEKNVIIFSDDGKGSEFDYEKDVVRENKLNPEDSQIVKSDGDVGLHCHYSGPSVEEPRVQQEVLRYTGTDQEEVRRVPSRLTGSEQNFLEGFLKKSAEAALNSRRKFLEGIEEIERGLHLNEELGITSVEM